MRSADARPGPGCRDHPPLLLQRPILQAVPGIPAEHLLLRTDSRLRSQEQSVQGRRRAAGERYRQARQGKEAGPSRGLHFKRPPSDGLLGAELAIHRSCEAGRPGVLHPHSNGRTARRCRGRSLPGIADGDRRRGKHRSGCGFSFEGLLARESGCRFDSTVIPAPFLQRSVAISEAAQEAERPAGCPGGSEVAHAERLLRHRKTFLVKGGKA